MDPETDTAQHIARLDRQIAKLRVEAATSKPIGDIVKYLLYFWLTLSVLLGIFGWTQLSDLNDEIQRAVTLEVNQQFPEDTKQYRAYQDLIADTKNLHDDFVELTKTYKERVEDLKYADIIASDFDIVGQVIEIIAESDTPKNIVDAQWRTRAIDVLQRLEETVPEEGFPVDLVFNVAQVARQLNQFKLAADMTNTAYEKDASPSNRALKLSSQVGNTTGEMQDIAYSELIEMVRTLDPQSNPQIVVSEAWNASETTRNYGPLIDAIDELIAMDDRNHVPSYVYAIQARALLRRSWIGDKELARTALEGGYEVFKMESSLSLWNQQFVDAYTALMRVIEEDREIASHSLDMGYFDRPDLGVPDLNQDDTMIALMDAVLPSSSGYPVAEISLDDTHIVDRFGWVFFRFFVESDGTYVVSVEAANETMDPIVFVRDSSHRLLDFDDDSGGGLDSLLEIELKEGSSYDIGVGPVEGESVVGSMVSISAVLGAPEVAQAEQVR